jgi:16S rRNA (guanine527-N7)-methyltransferase
MAQAFDVARGTPSLYSEAVLSLLSDLAREAGLEPGTAHLQQLEQYVVLLSEWSRHLNLTGSSQPDDIVRRQLPDAFHLVALLGSPRGRALDAGAGSGLVGIPLALLCPDIEVTLLEPRRRRCAFLRAACHELALPAQVNPARLEVVSERYELALSRATWPPPRWLELAPAVLAPDGHVAVFSSTRLASNRELVEVRSRSFRLADGTERHVALWAHRAGSVPRGT